MLVSFGGIGDIPVRNKKAKEKPRLNLFYFFSLVLLCSQEQEILGGEWLSFARPHTETT